MITSKKIVLLGHFGVGKTSLVRRFVEDSFSDNYKVTIGVHILKKEVTLPENQVNLIIWDIEGNEDITKTRSSYLLGSHGFIYVFDTTRKTTYENLASDLEHLKTTYNNVPVVVVGNKSDLVTRSHMKENKAYFKPVDYFSSAKTGANVDTIFEELTKKIIL
ncbi:small GTP-binding protein domain-containing protein [Sinomicrobium oceani]|uniref:Small GTP-binding protein domain-containing protein n=1 Tax=Sinomicrobium oceani TaxID=1150368 RepID=A0A1K1NG11_9FLAO|nr:Rab family GTPase [Sinomicrobium oceani]SFW34197.1 small GTP-binding protein domain-containing protein [Sinomicrobium oceani]